MPWFILAGLVAGFIDAIAGGGGLITLPAVMLILGPGTAVAEAIGTNKIAGLVAAGVALGVYVRAGHLDWRKGFLFTVCIAGGALGGSYCARFLPPWAFRVFLLLSCPLILWIVWKKELWIQKELSLHRPPGAAGIVFSGFACGFYDGVWGPGGGTFMLLSLIMFGGLPVLPALAISKLANFTSAGTALASYAYGGYVHWAIGGALAASVSVGAWFGARWATKSASRIVRPVLVCVVLLLVVKLITSWARV